MTARHLALVTLLITAASGLACLGIGKDPEGTDPGSCSDAADNDEDDLWDCEDPDCEGSPDCPDCEYASYFDFTEGFILAICGKLRDCGFFTDDYTYEDCLAVDVGEDTGEPWVCHDFDCETAATCVDQMEAVSCEDYGDGVGYPACEDYCSNL